MATARERDDRGDPLLDRPSWAPRWVPSVDDFRQRRRFRWVLTAVLFAGLAACVAEGADAPADPELGEPAPSTTDSVVGLAARFGTVVVELASASGQVLELCLLHADTPAERSQGLMHVTDFEGLDGMLFSNDEPVTNQFFMLDTPTPLTISWWAADGSFVSATDMTPCLDRDAAACERYGAAGPYLHAIEVPRGSLDPEVLAPGTRLSVGGACSAD